MLILTRRVGENVVVGDDVVVSVLEVRGDSVRLGIQAPKSVAVHREEVYRELQRANQQAARSAQQSSDDAVAAVARELGPGTALGQRRGSQSNRKSDGGSDLK